MKQKETLNKIFGEDFEGMSWNHIAVANCGKTNCLPNVIKG